LRAHLRKLIGVLAVLTLALSACGDDGEDSSDSGSDDPSATTAAPTATTEAEETPVSGGELVFGEYSEPRGLDPIVSTGAGVTGAIEMSAIYDTIMRWNPETGEYEERTAESLESNAAFTEWTLKLKPGILFHDGTPYNAEAVKWGMMRHKSGQQTAGPCETLNACPRNPTSSGVYMALISDIAVVDDLTLKFTLTEPWSAFAYALSDEASMIPSPTAYKAACPDPKADVAQCPFNLAPVGAGPFKIGAFKPKESITMVRNDNYYGGDVYLDGLKFLNAGDAGGDKTYEGFKAGTYDVAFLRAPTATSAAHDDGVEGYSSIQYGGGIFLINMGVSVNCAGGKPEPVCVGKPDGPQATTPPTASLKVRQAIAAAIDPEVINERGNDGKGKPGSSIFQEGFRWNPDVPGPEYDPEKAKQLVAEAKAEGWNGTVRLLYNNSPTAVNVGQATQTMLQAVGIDAPLDTTKDTTNQILQVTVQKDFDVVGFGIAVSNDDGAMAALAQNFSSTSPSNRVGYKNPKVDQALKDLRAAATDEEKTEQFGIIATELSRDIPALVWSAVEELVVWQEDVHGLAFNHSTSVHLDKAWIG
jgi:peptide/nickel transport system substrate-binding protein